MYSVFTEIRDSIKLIARNEAIVKIRLFVILHDFSRVPVFPIIIHDQSVYRVLVDFLFEIVHFVVSHQSLRRVEIRLKICLEQI